MYDHCRGCNIFTSSTHILILSPSPWYYETSGEDLNLKPLDSHCALTTQSPCPYGRIRNRLFHYEYEWIMSQFYSLCERDCCYIVVPGCMGDTQFHFRIRQCPGRKAAVKAHNTYNRDCPVSLQVGGHCSDTMTAYSSYNRDCPVSLQVGVHCSDNMAACSFYNRDCSESL